LWNEFKNQLVFNFKNPNHFTKIVISATESLVNEVRMQTYRKINEMLVKETISHATEQLKQKLGGLTPNTPTYNQAALELQNAENKLYELQAQYTLGDIQITVNCVTQLKGSGATIGDYHVVNYSTIVMHTGLQTDYIIQATYIRETSISTGSTTGNTIISQENIIVDYESGVYDNVIGFRVTNDQRIGYRYINSTGLTEEQYSQNTIDVTGWTHVTIVYKPYNKFKDISEDILGCYARTLQFHQ